MSSSQERSACAAAVAASRVTPSIQPLGVARTVPRTKPGRKVVARPLPWACDAAMTSAADPQVNGVQAPDERAPALRPPMVVSLGDARARSVDLAGGKAAALARAEGAGLATLGGLVLSTEFCADVDAGTPVEGHPVVAEAFRRAGGDDRSLVARSSSVVEDTATSSMAGQFESVIGVDGLDEFTAAVRTVLDSRVTAGAADEPIAVLVQPLIEPAVRRGPVRRSTPSPAAAIGGSCRPSAAGPSRSSAARSRARGTVLDPGGAIVSPAEGDGPDLPKGDLRRLAALSDAVAEVFGGPQDVEWAIGEDDQLWLLQSRPVTTEIRGVPQGPDLRAGPGGRDVPRAADRARARPVGAAAARGGRARRWCWPGPRPPREVGGERRRRSRSTGTSPSTCGSPARSPVAHPRRQLLNPVHAFRRMRVAWRVGRLRAAMPAPGRAPARPGRRRPRGRPRRCPS